MDRLGWLAFVLLACGDFAVVNLWRDPQYLDLREYAAGTAPLPFQSRILMAWVLRWTAGSSRWAPGLGRLAVHLPKEFHDPYLVVLLVTTVVAMFVAVLAARASLVQVTGDRKFASWAALLTLYMAYFNLIVVYGLTYTLPYDAPALAFFSLGVWLVLTQRYWLLLPVFALATANRETSCFLTVFLLLYAWFTSKGSVQEAQTAARRRAAGHAALQIAVWFAIRVWLHHHFLHNAHAEGAKNGMFTVQLVPNLKSLVKPPQWPLFLSLFGFTLPLFFRGYRWIADRALARSVAIVVALWGVAMLLVGGIVEIRVFDELTAFLVVALGAMAWDRWVLPARKWTASSR